ncbi:MAG: hypothetical protein QOD00_1929 [Blastocatellia bacterium]|nr:hypothetical protein [Blastocatellia bacterium]
MKRLSLFLVIICCLLSGALDASAQTRRLMTVADTLRVAGVGDAQISPDGEWVVYTVSITDGNATRSTLWLARTNVVSPNRPATDSVRTLQLLPDTFNAQAPRWSPDGRRIAFQGSQQQGPQQGQSGLWTISLDNRQLKFLTPVRSTNFFITYAGETFAWSPDSRRIAFINASEDDNETPQVAAAVLSQPASDPRVIDRIQYKSRTSFSDNARTHVWLVDVEAAERERPVQLTSGPFYDHALAWNPNGNEIAFLSNHETDPDANNNSDIFAVDLSGHMRQLTDTRGCEYEPAWSPDGKWIAYTATKRDVTTIDSVAEDAHVWVIESRGGAGRELTAAQDRRARSPRWSPDSRSVFYLAGDRGQTLLYRVGAEGGPIRTIFDNAPRIAPGVSGPVIPAGPIISPRSLFQMSSFSLSVSGAGGLPSLAFTLSDALHPAEIWTSSLTVNAALGRDAMRRISAHNDALLRSLILIEPEEINFRSFDGTNVQGWLMKPTGFRETQRFPLILSVHGGPHGMYGYAFNPTFQVYAARGYAVLYLNPRGSSGYGQRFSDGTLREWGGGDYQDLMRGVDEILRARSWIDAERLGVTGGSYGGFMTNWIVTQTTRFKAAVAAASVSNLISFYSTSLYQDLVHAEFGGVPWDDYELLWRWSPLRYIKQAQTPLMLIHGEQDNDVHITQAEEMYMALKRRGVETVLVRYPREGHGFREPAHRVDALERTVGWFDKFLK